MGDGHHPATYERVPRFVRGAKRPEREVIRPLPSNAEVKVDRSYRPTSAPPVCHHGADRGSFTVILSY